MSIIQYHELIITNNINKQVVVYFREILYLVLDIKNIILYKLNELVGRINKLKL
jgi:hypothetical protein